MRGSGSQGGAPKQPRVAGSNSYSCDKCFGKVICGWDAAFLLRTSGSLPSTLARGQTTELSAKQFDRAVSKIQNRQKRIMKLSRGIDAHRPQKNSARDLKIWRLHQERMDCTYSWIGRAVGSPKPISRNAVAAALKRQQRRIQERDATMGRFVELLVESIKEALDNRNLGTKALPQGPTVQ
jgi:hypothetical protein